MITKEKHFTKCETPNSSRIIEDKKHMLKLPNGNVEMANGTKPSQIIVAVDSVKTESVENNPSVPDAHKANDERQSSKETNGDDAASTAGGQKIGTVIPNRIFVGGFTPKTVDEDLWKFFSTISNITAAKIIYDRSGISKCYGFITFANPKDAKYIVKQTGGVMFSPMGRLRISQAVRKQMPHYPSGPSEYAQVPVSVPMSVQADGYFPNAPNSKPPVCIAYPVQAVQPVHHVPHMSTSQAGTMQVTSNGPQSQMQISQIQQQQQVPSRSAPSTSPRSSTAGSSESGIQNGHPHNVGGYPDNLYHGTMVAGPPTYVIPSMGIPYPATLPAYDATGLYTTCPGYAQPMPAYPYAVVLQPPQRDGPPTYAPSYGHPPLAYMPPPPTACYIRDASGKAPTHLPIMNSYIY